MKSGVTRRTFIQSAGVAGLIGIAAHSQGQTVGGGPGNPDSNLLRDAGDGEVYLIGRRRGRVTIKVSKREHRMETMSLITEDIPPRDAIPVHSHAHEEEFIYIQRGTGVFTFADDEHEVTTGSLVLVPRGVWHGLRNEGDETVHMVFGYTPAGFEDYFRAIGVRPDAQPKNLSADDWEAINNRFGIVYR